MFSIIMLDNILKLCFYLLNNLHVFWTKNKYQNIKVKTSLVQCNILCIKKN